MKLDSAWIQTYLELGRDYPKEIEILVDRFKRSHVPDDMVRIVVLWEPDGQHISDVMMYPDFYSYVLTYHQYILDNNPKAIQFIGVTPFVYPSPDIQKKFCLTTVIGHKSNKTYGGYMQRHELWFKKEKITIPYEFYLSGPQAYKDTVIRTIYGIIELEGQRRLGVDKTVVFDSMFHIAIENMIMYNFYTE
jgi:hypothetical protein